MKFKSSTSPQFWLLSAFIVLVFLTGGAARVDVQSLLLLRPASAVACALALLTLRREHLARFKSLIGGFGATLLLVLVYLIPLPPAIWHNLPGRDVLVAVDQAANLDDMWRPLTMTPINGVHTALSLLTPLAVLLFGIQLRREELSKLLPVMLAMGALSGFCGILQVIGSPTGPLYLYSITNNGSAVGLFSNRNHAAVLLACLFPMLATFASTVSGTESEQRVRQILAFAALIVTVPLILVTGSRSGLFVGLIGLLSAVLLYNKPQAGRKIRVGGIRWRVGPAPVLSAIAVLSLGLVTIFFSRAEALNRVFAQSAGEDTRGEYWAISLKMMGHYFPWGSGTGSFVESYQIFEPAGDLNPLYVNHAHNDWIEVVSTMGALGALALLVGICLIAARSLHIWRRGDPAQRSVKYAKMASVVIVMLAVASVTDYPLRTPSLVSLFAVCLLWLFSPHRDPQARDHPSEEATANRRNRPNPVAEAIRRVGIVRAIVVLALGLIGAYLSFAFAVAGVAAARQPGLALRFVPQEPQALTKQADSLLATNPQHPPRAVKQLAAASLRVQALNPRALRQLGYVESIEGHVPHARILVDLAARLSRREPGTQLWLINRAARDGDLPLALRHIDTLLRTNPRSQSLLYPTLLRGLPDPQFRKLLQSYMRRPDDSWLGDFLTYAITNAEDLSPLVDLVEEGETAHGTGLTIEQARLLMNRLEKASRFAALQRIYLAVPGAKVSRLSSTQFDQSDADERFGVAGWQSFDGPDSGTSFVRRGKGDGLAMELYVNPSTTRTVASKLLYLDPGSYTLSTAITAIDSGEGGGLRWELRCPTREGGSRPWAAALTRSRSTNVMTVPEDCRVQYLDLIGSGGQGQNGIEATISNVVLAPLGRTAKR